MNVGALATDSTDMLYDDVSVAHLAFRNVREKDAFLLFRALCRLSTKSLPERPDPKLLLFALNEVFQNYQSSFFNF